MNWKKKSRRGEYSAMYVLENERGGKADDILEIDHTFSAANIQRGSALFQP